MMIRPALTDEQKRKFEKELHDIAMLGSSEIQNTWLDNPQVIWTVADVFMLPSNIEKMLQGKLLDKYIALTNKVKNRTL